MFLMTTTTYPPDKATEIAKIFMELPELPPFVKRLHVLIDSDLIAGYKVYGLYEVENKKAYEGLVAIAERMTSYNKIEGCRFTIEPLLTPEEGLPMLGLAPPK